MSSDFLTADFTTFVSAITALRGPMTTDGETATNRTIADSCNRDTRIANDIADQEGQSPSTVPIASTCAG